MLFYLKKYPALEAVAAFGLALLAWGGMRAFDVNPRFGLSARVFGVGVVGAASVTAWTFAVHEGDVIAKGRAYADALEHALARHFADASPVQILLAFAAAAGEELLFRGFVQERFGIFVGALLFMAAHIGGRDIRVIGFWSFFHGIGFGLVYWYGGSVVAPIVAHGLFDLGAMIHFRHMMRAEAA